MESRFGGGPLQGDGAGAVWRVVVHDEHALAAARADAAAKDLGEAASASYGDIRDQARTKADEFRGRAQSVYSDASAYAQDYQSEAEAYIRSNPLQSVGIALGVGFLFGLILRR